MDLTQRGEIVGGSLRPPLHNIADEDARPLLQEFAGDGLADPPAGSSNDGGFVFESSHGVLLLAISHQPSVIVTA
jgi:hypothetical protein